ncbi:MAG: hypothetical protein IT320_00350 [Anaerolineae bacterium]|nr:hypothetical protein [Anaerolineae bacterium]
MFHAVKDIQLLHDRHAEMLRQAEQYRLLHGSEPQPNLLTQLQSKLVVWVDMARPQRNGDLRI